ncbi:MAG: hypothetical protein WCF95_04075 [bacterium]
MQKINNNISFKSNIHFVDKKTFDRIKQGAEIFVSPGMEMHRGKNFWTEEVKTCSAGGFISDFDAVGFHCYHSKRNFEKAQRRAANVLNKIKEPKNGLLIGGKSHQKCPYSMSLFENLKGEFSSKVKDISIFEKLKKYYGQTHMYYSKKEDTWWLCSQYKSSAKASLKTVQHFPALLDFFKNISIAKTDRLFVEGKEITREKAPKIFA